MNYGYMVVYNDPECAFEHFRFVGGFNTISAISNFYGEFSERYSTVDVDDELFYKLIQHLSVDDAIRLHNLLVPNYNIVSIYDVSKKLYGEDESEEQK